MSAWGRSLQRITAFNLGMATFLSPTFAKEINQNKDNSLTQHALHLPEGNRFFKATISTRTAKDSDLVRWGSTNYQLCISSSKKLGTLKFQELSSSGHAEQKKGFMVTLNSNLPIKLQVQNLATGKLVGDLRKNIAASNFTLEDISFQFLAWKNQKSKGDDEVKGRNCLRIECIPDPTTQTAYSLVEVWIDKEFKSLVKAKAYGNDHQVIKEFTVRSLQQLEDESWMLKVLEVYSPSLKARSQLELALETK